MRLSALPAFEDNFIWVLRDANRSLLVDPGEAAPVLAAADAGLVPSAILLTHHHPDHVGGVPELLRRWPGLPVFAPDDARIALDCERVGDGDRLRLLDRDVQVLAVPGHTSNHLAYVVEDHLFCGDTLFSLGCGRMFEGTPEQMLHSLQRLAALPGQTRVCCGHEYTLANAAFAREVEPGNAALAARGAEVARLRAAGEATLPSTIASERDCNPFLRCDAQEVLSSVGRRLGHTPADAVEAFATLRAWKDTFRA
ncbi:hydroxyacylglutathione hydrolase [Pseudoxanthomonas koreensis]|uniref:hydroxyacylglutathione hydrolase n=1 Tax=Pseudoxanthomonas koreensis TaxID=266061 RepID=UPI001391E89B|nr:hydroxyacylglutathione hydrolase [Pseudoxanthomonas koreensis]KAF1695639.1 hydroxyacylglutathione hydrolase [Pseudoxanthomonas koreensis]